MLVQIYEVSSPEEARALGELGVDHIGVLVGDGSFPREQSLERARRIFSAVPPSSKAVALSLSADIRLIEHIVSELKPAILHLGAASDLLTLAAVRRLKRRCGAVTLMRSIPVIDEKSIAVAQSYNGIADMLLLDSHRPGDRQIGALGVTHSWQIDRKIVESVGLPVIVAGGLGPDNGAAGGRRFKDEDGQRRWQPHQRFAKSEAICRSSEISTAVTSCWPTEPRR